MPAVLFSLLTVVPQYPESTMTVTGGVRSPAYSVTDRLALEGNRIGVRPVAGPASA